ncbi:MAG: phosphoribosyltransferase family protein [Sulfurimonas sp.]|nr:phosphoribosyltransferase family protein [Sulfurimonas sp.]
MKCLMCESFSLTHICSTCQTTFLTPSIYKRKILNNIEVISFYKYRDIKTLLHTKHTDLGYYIYSILAKNSLKFFADEFSYPDIITSIAVDDYAHNGYSHTAVLNKALKNKCIIPKFNKLRAKNRVSYSGKSREFRLLNPREFQLKDIDTKEVILVDDIITTGLTLNSAIKTIQNSNKNTLFCITLADASLN